MTELLDEKHSRREFFRCLGRYIILGGLACTAGVLILKKKSAATEGKPVDVSVCRSCIILSNCDKPTALLAKEEMVR